MGPNLVRVRKLEFLHRVFLSSKKFKVRAQVCEPEISNFLKIFIIFYIFPSKFSLKKFPEEILKNIKAQKDQNQQYIFLRKARKFGSVRFGLSSKVKTRLVRVRGLKVRVRSSSRKRGSVPSLIRNEPGSARLKGRARWSFARLDSSSGSKF